jgi:hypothetical protein
MHLPFHNYAGPGTHLNTRINRGDIPINKIDAAALIHDMEYVRDSNRVHADEHMTQSLGNGTYLSSGNLFKKIFALDSILGNERTMNRPDLYEQFKPKAEQLLKGYDLAFD